MRRNAFYEPQPANAAEIGEAMAELEMDAGYVSADILYDPEEKWPFAGYTARIFDSDAGEPQINTLGFETRDTLVAALREAGITDITEDI